jgi:four helix bundle protein
MPDLPHNGKRRTYDLEDRLLEYAAMVIRLVERLPKTRAANHIGGQLTRSGTSPMPNHREAQAAESKVDFVHKFKVVLKELHESLGWLKLIARVPLLPPKEVQPLIQETEELVKIFSSSIRTARARIEPR